LSRSKRGHTYASAAAKALMVAGALGSRLRLGGAALLAGSALARFGILAAGDGAARDPKYTVGPQRERS
jgi:hypothetical protein